MEIVANKIGEAGLRSRLAPTPSGFLHLGNAVNFLITWLMVQRAGGVLKLRIDDADCARCRPEYIEDIFVALDWLGITWDEGPSGPGDFLKNHSQRQRLDRYREVLDALRVAAPLFPCACSRRQIVKRSPAGIYPGTCRGRAFAPAKDHAVRVRVPEEAVVAAGDSTVALGRLMGDFVLWRRDNLPAYQLASLVDDLDDRMNCIVRGEDLRASTAAQLHLAAALGDAGAPFRKAAFHHHALIPGRDGQKLSKSDNARSLAAMRRQGTAPWYFYQAAARLLDLEPAPIRTLDELRHAFCAQK